MEQVRLKTKIIFKHETEANWAKSSYIPQQGEPIVVDMDEDYPYQRFKIGDGITNVSNLPFAEDVILDNISTNYVPQLNTLDIENSNLREYYIADGEVLNTVDNSILAREGEYSIQLKEGEYIIVQAKAKFGSGYTNSDWSYIDKDGNPIAPPDPIPLVPWEGALPTPILRIIPEPDSTTMRLAIWEEDENAASYNYRIGTKVQKYSNSYNCFAKRERVYVQDSYGDVYTRYPLTWDGTPVESPNAGRYGIPSNRMNSIAQRDKSGYVRVPAQTRAQVNQLKETLGYTDGSGIVPSFAASMKYVDETLDLAKGEIAKAKQEIINEVGSNNVDSANAIYETLEGNIVYIDALNPNADEISVYNHVGNIDIASKNLAYHSSIVDGALTVIDSGTYARKELVLSNLPQGQTYTLHCKYTKPEQFINNKVGIKIAKDRSSSTGHYIDANAEGSLTGSLEVTLPEVRYDSSIAITFYSNMSNTAIENAECTFSEITLTVDGTTEYTPAIAIKHYSTTSDPAVIRDFGYTGEFIVYGNNHTEKALRTIQVKYNKDLNYVINNLKEQDIQLASDIAQVEGLAKGALRAEAFFNYEEFIATVNNAEKNVWHSGQPFNIKTKGVPDLWVYDVVDEYIPYTYIDDQTVVNIVNEGILQVGYYRFSDLETNKIDDSSKADKNHKHTVSDITDFYSVKLNADTLDGKHADDFAEKEHDHYIEDVIEGSIVSIKAINPNKNTIKVTGAKSDLNIAGKNLAYHSSIINGSLTVTGTGTYTRKELVLSNLPQGQTYTLRCNYTKPEAFINIPVGIKIAKDRSSASGNYKDISVTGSLTGSLEVTLPEVKYNSSIAITFYSNMSNTTIENSECTFSEISLTIDDTSEYIPALPIKHYNLSDSDEIFEPNNLPTDAEIIIYSNNVEKTLNNIQVKYYTLNTLQAYISNEINILNGDENQEGSIKKIVVDKLEELKLIPGKPKYNYDLEFTLVENDGEPYYIVSGIGECTDTEINIPSNIDGIKVLSIGNYAFQSCYNLTIITIPDSVTSISSYAFCDCKNLASVTISDSVTSISNVAFSGCIKLVEVINKSSLNIVAGDSSYGEVALYALEVHTGDSKIVNKDGYLFYTYNGINYLIGYTGNETELVLPESYNGENYEIYKRALGHLNSLTSVIIPDSIISIGDYAFYNCDGLNSITIPDSVTSIGKNAFSDCSALTLYCEAASQPSGWHQHWNPDNRPVVWGFAGDFITANNIYAKKTDLPAEPEFEYAMTPAYGENGGEDVVTIVGMGTYANKKDIVIPTKTKDGQWICKIAASAFHNNTVVESLEIASSIYLYEEFAFSGCTNLSKVIFNTGIDGPKQLFDADNNIKELHLYNADQIFGSAFPALANLEKLYLKNSNSFSYGLGMQKLKEAHISDMPLDEIFNSCTALTEVTLENVPSIMGSFRGCTSLKKIVLPKTITYVMGAPFEDCNNLTIYCEQECPTTSVPEGWDESWNYSDPNDPDTALPVIWGYEKDLPGINKKIAPITLGEWIVGKQTAGPSIGGGIPDILCDISIPNASYGVYEYYCYALYIGGEGYCRCGTFILDNLSDADYIESAEDISNIGRLLLSAQGTNLHFNARIYADAGVVIPRVTFKARKIRDI